MKKIVAAAMVFVLQVAVAAHAAAPAAGEARPAAARKLDVNRATAAELVNVPGIGERLAQAIIGLREKTGQFTTLDELLEVRGIGEKNLAQLAEYLTVAPQAAQPPAGGAPPSR